jgi:hypothetical protein
MKKPSFSTIALVTILGILAFVEIKDTVVGDKSIFLVRWIYSSRGYAKKIEIKPYLLNDEQTLALLAHPENTIEQPPQKDLYLKNVNIVLRLKNHGGASAWGTLAWRIGDQQWSKIDVTLPPAYAKDAKRFDDFIIPVGVVVLLNNENPPQKIETKWVSLYTYY